MIFNEISTRLETEGVGKTVRTEMYNYVGRVSEENNQKL